MNSTQTTNSLTSSALQLGSYIKELPELTAFEEAQKHFQNDAEASQLLKTYNNKVQSLQMMQQMGQPVDTLQSEYEELNAAIEANDVLTELFTKRDSFTQKLQEINNELSELIGFDFASMAKPPSSCC